MKHITEDQAIALLKKHADSEKSYEYVLGHVKAVRDVAMRIASEHTGLDMDLINIGSLLHDIGRFNTGLKGKEKIRHGVIGAEILRKEGLPEEYALICERHIGVGILKEDIIKQELPLEPTDYVPESNEEKIIAHADNMIFGHEEKTFQDVLDRFKRELGEKHVARAIALKAEIDALP